MMQVANQTRIFGLAQDARSRINTVYMTFYFVGGALGSALASMAWWRWQWNGVCGLAVSMVGLAGIWHALHGRKVPKSEDPPPTEAQFASMQG